MEETDADTIIEKTSGHRAAVCTGPRRTSGLHVAFPIFLFLFLSHKSNAHELEDRHENDCVKILESFNPEIQEVPPPKKNMSRSVRNVCSFSSKRY
jgi:hypothetical protein